MTYETVRQWCLKFGQTYANQLRRRQPQPGDKWHLDLRHDVASNEWSGRKRQNWAQHWRRVHISGLLFLVLVFSISREEELLLSCPHCISTETSQLAEKTSLGYHTFHCSACGRRFNERTGTAFNNLQFPTDIVLLVVLWRLRYKLSLRDVAEMFLERGSNSLMKRSEMGKRSALLLSQNNYAPGARVRWVGRGMLMKPTARSTVLGAIFTEQSTGMTISWTRRSRSTGMWLPPSSSSSKSGKSPGAYPNA